MQTTNVIEHVNKEFYRQRKPMEILEGEHACYILFAFVFLKMELRLKAKPIGKVPINLPYFVKPSEDYFTHYNWQHH